jgi:hypothetical protein
MSGEDNEKTGRSLVRPQQRTLATDIEAGRHNAKQCSCGTTPLLSSVRSFVYWVAAIFVVSFLMWLITEGNLKIEQEARGCSRPDWSVDDYTTSDMIKSSFLFVIFMVMSVLAVNGLMAFVGCEPLVWP